MDPETVTNYIGNFTSLLKLQAGSHWPAIRTVPIPTAAGAKLGSYDRTPRMQSLDYGT